MYIECDWDTLVEWGSLQYWALCLITEDLRLSVQHFIITTLKKCFNLFKLLLFCSCMLQIKTQTFQIHLMSLRYKRKQNSYLECLGILYFLNYWCKNKKIFSAQCKRKKKLNIMNFTFITWKNVKTIEIDYSEKVFLIHFVDCFSRNFCFRSVTA